MFLFLLYCFITGVEHYSKYLLIIEIVLHVYCLFLSFALYYLFFLTDLWGFNTTFISLGILFAYILDINMEALRQTQPKSFSERLRVMEYIWSYFISDSLENYFKLSEMNKKDMQKYIRHIYTHGIIGFCMIEWLEKRKLLFLKGQMLNFFSYVTLIKCSK